MTQSLEETLQSYAEVKMKFNALYALLGDYRKQLDSWESQLTGMVKQAPLSQSDIKKLTNILGGK